MSFTITKRQLIVVSDCFIQTAGLTEGRARPAPCLSATHLPPNLPSTVMYYACVKTFYQNRLLHAC